MTTSSKHQRLALNKAKRELARTAKNPKKLTSKDLAQIKILTQSRYILVKGRGRGRGKKLTKRK